MLAERTALRTTSAQSWLRYAAVLERLGDEGQVLLHYSTTYQGGYAEVLLLGYTKIFTKGVSLKI